MGVSRQKLEDSIRFFASPGKFGTGNEPRTTIIDSNDDVR
jgi:hypothetical protein